MCGRDPNRSCTHCSRKGPDVNEYSLLHGFPEWCNEQKNNTNQGGGTSGSSQRGRGGRYSNSGNHGRRRSNSSRAISNNTCSTLSINNDQIAQLLQLLRQTSQSNISSERLSGKRNLSDIIIDTGASHHMTGNLSLLTNVMDIIPSSVQFPNGRASQGKIYS